MIPGLFERETNEVFDFEGEVLEELAAAVPRGLSIVEVGTFRGRSTAFLAAGSERGNRVPVWGVDVWIRPEFETTIEEFGHGLIETIQAPSVDVASRFATLGPRRRIGLIHIDGSHRPDDLRADIQGWGPLVAEGGVMVFHDFQHEDLRPVIEEEMNSGAWAHEPPEDPRLHRVGIYRRTSS